MKRNKEVDDELEKQFPKGDKARGRALVLYAIAQIELEKKDKEIKELKYKIEEIEDGFNIVSGKDAEKFIKNMEHEETRELSKENEQAIDKIQKFVKANMFTKDGQPKCSVCGKPMENAYDTILKKKSEYLWKSTCNCIKNKNFRLSVG